MAGLSSTCTLQGDFDVTVAFNLTQWPIGNGARAGLILAGARVERTSFAGGADHDPHRETYVWDDGISTINITDTTDYSGQLRMKRTGSTGTALYRSGTQWIVIGSSQMNTNDAAIQIEGWSHDQVRIANQPVHFR